ncbi:hypothetical protein XENORESO_007061, partial [Xenotaenia resolanae]
LSVCYYGNNKEVLGRAILYLTAIEISLDVDADRDGIVEKNNPDKESWKWGPNGHGAILLVNCDSEKSYNKKPDSEEVRISKVTDLKDMSLMVLRTRGPAQLPKGYKLTMHISQGDAEGVRVFRAGSPDVVKNSLQKIFSAFVKDFPLVLSSEVLSQEVPYLGGSAEMNFYVEGLRFPDKDFDGLITISLSLLEPICEGPDFGYVTRVAHRKDVSSLDSFGNLEVSPPVTVNGKKYPLGRILIGVAFPTATKGRNMTKVVQDFLWAQKVQEPVALFSDWLFVGHIDEFMSFVPAPDRKSCIDWNRDVLKRELGLDDDDIIDLPILFKLENKDAEYRAVAYYPDMVNMIVLGKNLGIPKPFGPKVNGRCVLEAEMCSLMEALGLNCTFIDDFATYHKLLGEVHCGSNVRRKPFDFKWWNLEL